MKSLRLAVEHTAETIHPMHAFVCASPAVEREVLLEGRTEDGVRTLLFYVEGDPAAYEAALEARESLLEYDVRPDESEDGFFLYVRAPSDEDDQLLAAAFQRETVVVLRPIEFRADRTMRLTLVGHGDALQGVLADLPDDLGVTVLSVGTHARAMEPGLSDRQRDAVEAAWRVGYYEVPREGDVEAVAAELDCAVSTASVLLRRAQRHLVADALDAVR